MRLIDADALIQDLDELQKDMIFTSHGERMIFDDMIDFAVNRIEDAESIDAVPVVRCKDCKHWIPCQGEELKGHMYCEWAQWLVGENAYCVYGERKGHADNYPSGE